MNERSIAAKNEPVNLKLAEHIRGCRNCASLAAADDILNRAVAIERVKSPDAETPLSFLKTRIESLASQTSQKEHEAMATLKDKILNHPVLSFGFMGTLFVLFLMAVIPVSCSRDVGYNMNVGDTDNPVANAITSDADGTASITFANNTNDGAQRISLNPKRMIDALKAIGITDAKLQVTASQNGQTIEVSGLSSREEARQALLALVEASGFEGKVETTPRQASFEGSLLEQALNGIRELVISSDGKTDEEIRNEISAALEAAGVSGADVEYTSTPDGRKMIFVGQGGEGDSVQIEQAFQWNEDGAPMGAAPGDSTMVIEITSDGNTQDVRVEKKVVVGDDN